MLMRNPIPTKTLGLPRRVALLSVTLAALVLSGCVSVASALKANHDVIADKVYRLEVSDKLGFVDTGGYERADSGKTAYKKVGVLFELYGGAPSPEDAVPYRFISASPDGAWEGTSVFNNGPAGNIVAHVADNVPLLKMGDLVDVYVYGTSVLSVKDRHHATVIRLVCLAEDKACIKHEKSSGRAPGRVISTKGQFDPKGIIVSPHMDLNGDWLPGLKPARPAAL